MSQYLQKISQAVDQAASEMVEDRIREFSDQERLEAAVLLGRAQAADRIAVTLSAEVIRFVEHFETTKLYRALGFNDFVTFLQNSGLHSITKHRYYDRKKLLNKEGDPVFDALTVAGVPLQLRMDLDPGDVAIDGDNIVIKGNEDIPDQIVHKDDHQSILGMVRNLATQRKALSHELAAAEKVISDSDEKHDTEKRELYDEIDRIKAAKAADLSSDPHTVARVEMNLALAKLSDIAGKLSDIEKSQFRDGVLEDLARHRSELAAAYRVAGRAKAAAAAVDGTGLSDEEYLDALLDNVDLDDPDNDAELASQL